MEYLNLFFALGALLVSAISALYTYRQIRVSTWQAKMEYVNGLRTWAFGAIEIMAQLRHAMEFADPTPEYAHQKVQLLSQLSAQIDQGRLFLPNVDLGDGFGANKPAAYTGYRPLVLDYLVLAYTTFRAASSSAAAEAAELARIDELQRDFISEIQQLVDPKALIRTFEHDFKHKISTERTRHMAAQKWQMNK
jgi:hypothetical protein